MKIIQQTKTKKYLMKQNYLEYLKLIKIKNKIQE
jgi:hypothetical protein